MNNFKRFIFLSAVALSSVSFLHGFDNHELSIYDQQFSINDSVLHVHIGDNMWLTMQPQNGGEYKSPSTQYVKTWKCPYCHKHYPEGKACSNKNCPSKYTDEDE